MRAILGTSGLLRVLDDRQDALRNIRNMHETVFHVLHVATVEGTASHLIDIHEDACDGYAAWDDLLQWYDDNVLTTETVEDARARLDTPRRVTWNSEGVNMEE